MKLLIGLLLLLLALLLLTGCYNDAHTVDVANQEELLNPSLIGTNAAGTKLYRVLVHNGNAQSEYFYYWAK